MAKKQRLIHKATLKAIRRAQSWLSGHGLAVASGVLSGLINKVKREANEQK